MARGVKRPESTRAKKPTEATAPTVIVKSNTNSADVQEHVQHDIGVATVTHDGTQAVTELDQIDFQQGVDMVGFEDKATKLKFYEEKLVINIMQATDKNAETFVYLSINGEGAGADGQPWLPRGVDVTVKRKHVEKLLRSRPSRYESQQYVDQDGERKVRYPETAALLYPFQIVSDPNPKGRDWMRQILAERA